MIRQYLINLMRDRGNDSGSGFVKGILAAMAGIYGAAVRVHDLMYRKGLFPVHALPKPVISVGNITVGGVGKTPLVAMIARHLRQQHRKPAVLIRGYHRSRNAGGWESDEATLLRESLPEVPILVGRDRLRGANEILKRQDLDVFLLDDGFQHRRLVRDLDIVAVDATNPFGNGALVPRGILREPLNALKRAHLIVITKSDWGPASLPGIERVLRECGVRVPVVHAVHRPSGFRDLGGPGMSGLEAVRGRPVCLLSGIGDPEGFERMARSLGADVRRHHAFPDHHWFRGSDIDDILDICSREKAAALITTSKDSVRLRPFTEKINRAVRGLILTMDVAITYESEIFFQRIDRLFRR